ncbi:MAG TPA: PilN domain-containing protein [Anaerolineae bacterium]
MSIQRGTTGDKAMTPGRDSAPPRKLSRAATVLWLIATFLVVLFVTLSLVSSAIHDDVTRIHNDVDVIQATLASVPTPIPEVQRLQSTLSVVQTQDAQVAVLKPTLIAGRPAWPAAMAAIANVNPDQIGITSLMQDNTRITLAGQAVNDTAVIAYARALEQSNLFSRVIVQSITVIATPVFTPTGTATPVLTPTATFTPTATNTPTLTPSPTTNPRDALEPDDTQPKPVILGQPQSHNFYPSGDVDMASFLAKAGRFYRVHTSDLAPGVDTLMTVTADATYTNDDVRPGLLSSEVIFQNASGADVVATIRVTNRGQFGSDKTYNIVVEEMIPTPTGTLPPTLPPTATPTPSPTNTGVPSSTPTATLPPTSSPTPTTDLRDLFEPDDSAPRLIAIGETQTHNFYPDGDVDQISFFAKSGRRYSIVTFDLALGVDTFMTATLGAQTWSNDDWAAPGSGNFASAVCFLTPFDGTAVAKVTNVARQYDPTKTYKIVVNEITDLTQPPCNQANPAARRPGRQGVAGIGSARLAGSASLPLMTQLLAPQPIRPWERDAALVPTVEFVILLEVKATAP